MVKEERYLMLSSKDCSVLINSLYLLRSVVTTQNPYYYDVDIMLKVIRRKKTSLDGKDWRAKWLNSRKIIRTIRKITNNTEFQKLISEDS